MKIKVAGSFSHPTYKAATAAVADCFAPVASKVAILAAVAVVKPIEGALEVVSESRPAVNYVETIGKDTTFDLALDDAKAAEVVIANLKTEAAKVGVTLTGSTHVCRHDESPSKWIPCVAESLGGK